MLSLGQTTATDKVLWMRQRRDEIDVLAASLGALAGDLHGEARVHAHRAIAHLHAIRSVFAQRLDRLGAKILFTRDAIEKTAAELDREWHGVEIAFEAFISAAAERPDVLHSARAARARARTQSWETALAQVRTASSIAVEQARRDLDAIMGSIAADQVKLRTFSIASDQAWKTMKLRLEETRTVYERTWTRILEALRQPS
jgi:septal ring factor EnvC (AmiA/AmiB activator)